MQEYSKCIISSNVCNNSWKWYSYNYKDKFKSINTKIHTVGNLLVILSGQFCESYKNWQSFIFIFDSQEGLWRNQHNWSLVSIPYRCIGEKVCVCLWEREPLMLFLSVLLWGTAVIQRLFSNHLLPQLTED